MIERLPGLSRPLRNSYWVEPGRLLAGEYPGAATLAATTERVQSLLAAGVTLFVDLTVEDELSSYAMLFDYVSSERPIRHVRESIRDHDVPASMAAMQRIIETIDQHLSDNGVAYVHCRAGIGRTGTVIGCYLARRGLDANAAIERLNTLWCECERSRTWPSIPETEAQIEFIRRWSDHVRNQPAPVLAPTESLPVSATDRYEGALLGLAIGDALGASIVIDDATGQRAAIGDLVGGGSFNLPRGAWLSDTAMTVCLAESLLTMKGNDAQDQMQRYLSWQRDGASSSTGAPLAVPEDVRRALAQWQWNRKPIAGSHNPTNRDPHPLVRTAAVALYYAQDVARALREAAEAARPTLQTPAVLDTCRAYAAALITALHGEPKETLLAFRQSAVSQALRRLKLKPEVLQIVDGWWRGPIAPRDAKDALGILSTALWTLERYDNFVEGVLSIVNSSALPATAGAAYGALAGAYFGANNIPKQWRDAVLKSSALTELARRLANR